MSIYINTASVLKKKRMSMQATLQEVASWVGMSASQVNALENGYHKFPLKKIPVFCTKLLIDANELENAIVDDHRLYIQAYRRTYANFQG